MYKRIKSIKSKPLRLIAIFLFFIAIALLVHLTFTYLRNEPLDNWVWIDSLAYAIIYWVVNFYDGNFDN